MRVVFKGGFQRAFQAKEAFQGLAFAGDTPKLATMTEKLTEKTVCYLGSDHRGFPIKARFVARLREQGVTVVDLGTDSEVRCDATTYAVKLAQALKDDPKGLGILICGTGQVMAMTANRYRHLRAALCVNTTMARMAREHNDANVLVLGAHVIGIEVAQDCLDIFMKTAFLGGRYAERCKMLEDLGGL